MAHPSASVGAQLHELAEMRHDPEAIRHAFETGEYPYATKLRRQVYEKRKAKVPILVANKTVSNKLAQPIYHMLKRREPFDETRAFGCVFPWRTVSLGLATSPVILIAVAMAT